MAVGSFEEHLLIIDIYPLVLDLDFAETEL